jgi:succinate-semialdehyde dehydrogenase/glutarate-semialdehyde dehydrogenase
MYEEVIELFIDGKWTTGASGVTEPLINPATGETLATVPHCNKAELDQALLASKRAFGVWKAMTAIERCRILLKAADLIDADIERIARVLTMENGKPLVEARGEIAFSADALRWYAEEGKRTYGRITPGRLPNQRQIVLKEPVGPTASFCAWNFPASNVIRKIGGALGAGCSLILKTAEETPGTAVAFARCLEQAGLPPGVLQLVFGESRDISGQLLASPIIKKISLTGSTTVGKVLMKQAADTLKRATMELGGHAPVIVHHDADFDLAVNTLVAAKYRNAGQVCTSPTRFYVHESIYARFVEAFAAKAAVLRIGNGLDAETQMGPIIAGRRVTAIKALVDDAVAKGARLVTGGKPIDRAGTFFEPTVLAEVPDDALILQEEPFGPVASFMSFSTVEEVLERANSTPYGLASFVFTRSAALAQVTEAGFDAGMVGVNNTAISTPETPFGGVNESGFGSESGVEGLEAYLRVKAISEVFN